MVITVYLLLNLRCQFGIVIMASKYPGSCAYAVGSIKCMRTALTLEIKFAFVVSEASRRVFFGWVSQPIAF